MNEIKQHFHIPFFELPPTECKVYHDGGHFVAVPYVPTHRDTSRRRLSNIQEMFDSLYDGALEAGMSASETQSFIRDNLCCEFDTEDEMTAFIEDEMKRKARNLGMRKKRFRRKAYLNEWTHFITITYDDKKHDETSFRQKLRRSLSNFHTRRGWRYMGVFERAPETKRLHFHALLYVPEGEMVGALIEKRDYSTKAQQMQTTHENDFFAKRFGRNDFADISTDELQHGGTIGYLLKYIGKTGEKITYSRGIPTEMMKMIDGNDIAAEMLDFVVKYVLFDDFEAKDKVDIPPPDMAEIYPRFLC